MILWGANGVHSIWGGVQIISFHQNLKPDVSTVGLMICNEYAKMSLEERAIFDSYLNDYSLDCCGDCEKCCLLDCVYKYMREAESTDAK